jgi:penicillin-binding protein 2
MRLTILDRSDALKLTAALALLAGCGSRPLEPPAAPPAPDPAPTSAPAIPSAPAEPDLQPLVRAALSRVSQPAAAVVLSAGTGALLAHDGQRGADAARTPRRPGSTLKPLLSSIAIEAGALQADTQVSCEGKYAPIDGFRCFGEHGRLGLEHALATSCNAYFFDVARGVGLDRTVGGLRAHGFGRPTGLVPGEEPGLLPDRAWLDARAGKTGRDGSWPGWAAQIGGGHGPIEVTLVQLGAAYVRLAQQLSRGLGSEAQRRALVAVRQGLIDAVHAEHGTARRAAVSGVTLAGKTGSAEGGRFGDDAAAEGKGNGWFAGFAPAERPDVVVAVVVLDAGPGGESAAPIAGEIFRGWHERAAQPRP